MQNKDSIKWEKGSEVEILLIREAIMQFENYSNNNLPDETAALVSSNVVIVNVLGMRFMSKNEFHKFIANAMQGALSNLVIRNEITDIRFLRPDVAVVSGVQVAATRDGTVLKEHGAGALTMVLTKEHGKWLFAVAQNTMIGSWTN